MAYIVLVNPTILHDAGIPFAAAACATCLSAAIASLGMGLWARYPLALAPGMGLNAYFVYSVVGALHIPWQTALGAVFLSGLLFLVLTLSGLRTALLNAFPSELIAAVSVGVGIFIAYIGLRSGELLVPHAVTALALGDLHKPAALLCCVGLFLIAVLTAMRIRGAILIGIVLTTAIAALAGLAQVGAPGRIGWQDLTATAFQLDLRGSLRLGLTETIFVFFFVDFFDNLGTLVAVSKKAGLLRNSLLEIPRLRRILLVDSFATMLSALSGTSTVVSYIESAAGIEAGGRSGFTAVVVGVLFLLALLAVPVFGIVPPAATAPALIIVGSLMMTSIVEISWTDPVVALPAFLTILLIPLTYSIANGLSIGFTALVVLKLATGRRRELHPLTVPLALLFVVRFAYLSRG